MIPNLKIAQDSEDDRVEVFYDFANRQYGLRQSKHIIKDGVYISSEKAFLMTMEQLRKLAKDIEGFVRERN